MNRLGTGRIVSLGLATVIGATGISAALGGAALGGAALGGAVGVAPAPAVAPADAPVSSPVGVVDLLDPAEPATPVGDGSRQPVKVDESVLRADDPDVAVRLDLAPGVSPTATLRQADPVAGGYLHWTGDLAGVPNSMATIIRRGAAVSGLVSSPDGSYTITTQDSGTQIVTKVSTTTSDGDLVLPAPNGLAAQSLPATPADPNPVVDVLVAYTPRAAAAAGGTSAARSLAALAVAVSNDSFAASGVNLRVNLLGTLATTAPHVGYASAATLTALRTPGDGAYDNVHAARDTMGADLVSLFVADGGANCGIAYYPKSATSGFSVVAQGCAVANLSFPHELGHNLGASHDRHVSSSGPYPYGFGTVNVAGRWRTIMAYNNRCAAAGVYCRRLARWSNPDQRYRGALLGVPIGQKNAADNRSALNKTAATVAGYRRSAASQVVAPSTPQYVRASDGWNSTISWAAPATGATSVARYTVTSSPPGWTGTALQSARMATPVGLAADTTYTFSVRATNAAGTSSESAPTVPIVWRADRTPPTLTMVVPTGAYTLSNIAAGWSATDAASGVATVDARYTRARYDGRFGTPVYPSDWQRTTVAGVTMSGLASGYTYCVSARARDVAGNVSAWSRPRCGAVALDDRSLAASSGWTRATGDAYHGGTATVTSRAGATLTRTNLQATRVYLIATRCAACGTVGVYLDGSLIKKISLRSTTTTYGDVLTVAVFSGVRYGTLSVRSLTSGRTIQIDGLALSRV
jgi:hypothetical protein